MSKIRAVFRLIAFIFVTIYYVSGVLIRRPFYRKNPYYFLGIEKKWARTLLKVMGMEVEVESEIPGKGYLLLGNHRSYVDVLLIAPFIPSTFVAKHEVSKWPLVGWGCRSIRVVFVDRKDPNSRRNTRERIRENVLNGLSMMVFPEGTTTVSPNMNELKPGMFFAAAEAGIPIVPVALEYEQKEIAWVGDDTFMPHFLKTFGRKKTHAKVRFGPVMEDSDGDMLKEKVSKWIRENITEMQTSYGHVT